MSLVHLVSMGVIPVVFLKRTGHLVSEVKYIVIYGTIGHRIETGVNIPKTIIMVSHIARGHKGSRGCGNTGCGYYLSYSSYNGDHFSCF